MYALVCLCCACYYAQPTCLSLIANPAGNTAAAGAAAAAAAGVCSWVSAVNCSQPAGTCTMAGVCNPTSGTCQNPAMPDGTTCNGNGICQRGNCSTPVSSGFWTDLHRCRAHCKDVKHSTTTIHNASGPDDVANNFICVVACRVAGATCHICNAYTQAL
jgi:hypothetical protein